MTVSDLSPERLRLLCSLDSVNCKTSEELGPVEGIIGQERALKALKFAIDMKGKGFNIYAGGLPGTGKRPATRSYLEGVAEAKPTPPDWCYVYNFENSYEPTALKLPAGMARTLQKDLRRLIDQAKRAVPKALQSSEFVSRTSDIRKKSEEERSKILGALKTDFTLVKGGSLHKANGGYLILGVNELLSNQFSYDGLKRALQSGSLGVEELGERLGTTSIKSLTPQPIPLNVKVVLAGDPSVYQVLYLADPDFKFLFKVKADFDDSIERNDKNVKVYGSFVHSLCESEGLNHLEASAIAKVVEYGSRLAEDQNKLSTRFPELADVVREASFYASQDGGKYVRDVHIMKALEEKVYRSNLIDQKVKEMIQRGIILIDTSGSKVGQVNGLSVISLGDFEFGQPSRITASTGMGRGGLIDIERESKIGGQIHTKGVLIISGYLANKYARDRPLSVACRLVFEQSYGGVDGDSASSTELYAILSALSDLPIRQNFAVTGSVNQRGEVQAIGGINEKIEGFYGICKARGLKGDEGIMMPQSNVQHLMLSEEVVEAVRKGQFHIYPVESIDQGIEILTGVKAGEVRS